MNPICYINLLITLMLRIHSLKLPKITIIFTSTELLVKVTPNKSIKITGTVSSFPADQSQIQMNLKISSFRNETLSDLLKMKLLVIFKSGIICFIRPNLFLHVKYIPWYCGAYTLQKLYRRISYSKNFIYIFRKYFPSLSTV